MPKRNYIGLACSYHDPALAVVNDAGEVVYAEGTERYLQSKRALNCVPDNIPHIGKIVSKYCDPDAEIHAVKSWRRRYTFFMWWLDLLRSPLYSIWPRRSHFRDGLDLQRFVDRASIKNMRMATENLRYTLRFKDKAHRYLKVRTVNHHLTHAAAACYTSPYTEAVCAIIDGFGEGTSTAYFHYTGGRIKRIRAGRSLNSLGLFYAAVCHACGFEWDTGEEWKVMGMAPYGKYNETAYRLLKQAVPIRGLRVTSPGKNYDCRLWRDASDIPPADLAYTGQLVFEECMTEILNELSKLNLSKNLIIGGGCALNSTYNGMILDKTPFESAFSYSCPADDGNALGAALQAWHEDHPGQPPRAKWHTPYLGSEISQEVLGNLVRFDRSGQVTHHPGRIHEVAADLLAKDKIIAWCQGRAEFGPRALGNRSILADPRADDVKDRINARVKFREEFRPFAPSILHEYGDEYFEHYQETPYMERTLKFKDAVKAKVPGVVHVNGTGRLQTVKKEWNERYYLLIDEFRKRTGVPIVLNTSFNVMGKPIVHSVEDAIAVLHTTGLDALVLGDYLIEKPERK